MPDTYSCISIGLYHTSIAMCMCSFIWFACTLFLNAECFVFSRSVLQDAKGSCHFHHDTIQGTVSSGNLPFQTVHKTILYLPFRFARRPFYNRQSLGAMPSHKKMPGSFLQWCCCICGGFGRSLCLVSQVSGSTNPCLITPPAPCSWGYAGVLINPTDDVKEAQEPCIMGVHCGWWSPIWKQQPWTLRTSRLNSESSQITQETAWI